MKLVVISPEGDEPRELAVLADLFAAGLMRYHVRKPGASASQLAAWLRTVPSPWRRRLVLHSHHELAARFSLGGCHWRDEGAPEPPGASGFTSRSCHDLATLRDTLGRYDAVLFGPLFPSLSKPGHGPRGDLDGGELAALLTRRTPAAGRTAVFALGGVTAARVAPCHALGFDGVAVLGAIWQATDPLAAFRALDAACARTALIPSES